MSELGKESLLQEKVGYGSPTRESLILKAIIEDGIKKVDRGIGIKNNPREFLYWIKRIKALDLFKVTIGNTTYAWREKYSKIYYSCEQLVKQGHLGRAVKSGSNDVYYFSSFARKELSEIYDWIEEGSKA